PCRPDLLRRHWTLPPRREQLRLARDRDPHPRREKRQVQDRAARNRLRDRDPATARRVLRADALRGLTRDPASGAFYAPLARGSRRLDSWPLALPAKR